MTISTTPLGQVAVLVTAEKRSQTRARRLRPTALVVVALLGAAGLAQTSQALAAGGAASAGLISAPSSKVVRVLLGSDFSSQLTSAQYGDAFWSAYPVIYDVTNAAESALPTTTAQTFGGAGTANNPFWIQTSGMMPASNGLWVTQKLSYSEGNEYIRNDITVTNAGATPREVQIGQIQDCFFAGSDVGQNALEPGKFAHCMQGIKKCP